MNNITKLEDDVRDIEAVVFPNDCEHKVGRCGVTKITSYSEPAEFCYVPWIAVLKGDVIYARIPAYQVSIYYRVEEAK